jgi:GTP-binding protein
MKILQAEYVISAPGLKFCPDFEGLPEVVLVGRSNVGKSSFINSMTWRKNLARTSNTPGKTRYINFYKIKYEPEREGVPGEGTAPGSERAKKPANPTPKTMLFVDLPGYGYAKVSKSEQEQWRQQLEAYLSKRESIRLVVQLIDARHGPQDNDIQMFEWLQFHGRRVLVVLTKTDKLSRNEVAGQIAKTARALDQSPEQIIPFSAEKHTGRDTVWPMLESLPANVALSPEKE